MSHPLFPGYCGGEWKLPIICLLAAGEPARYSVLKKKLNGITNMMLSQSLKELGVGGIVHRKQYNEIPPRVEYTLTEAGSRLLPSLGLLAEWGMNHMEENEAHTVRCTECRTVG